MSRSTSIAQRDIDNLKVNQYREQNKLAGLRQRGITNKQVMPIEFPIVIRLLEINQYHSIYIDLQRDKLIDFLII